MTKKVSSLFKIPPNGYKNLKRQPRVVSGMESWCPVPALSEDACCSVWGGLQDHVGDFSRVQEALEIANEASSDGSETVLSIPLVVPMTSEIVKEGPKAGEDALNLELEINE